MNSLKRHTLFKLGATIVVLLLFVPSLVKIHHIHEHESHKECDNANSLHFHELEVDCDFQKLQLNNNYIITLCNNDIHVANKIYKIPNRLYSFLYNYQHLSFSLRAPPCLS